MKPLRMARLGSGRTAYTSTYHPSEQRANHRNLALSESVLELARRVFGQ